MRLAMIVASTFHTLNIYKHIQTEKNPEKKPKK